MRRTIPRRHAPHPDKESKTLCDAHRRDAVHMAATRAAVTCQRCLRWEADLEIAYADEKERG